MIVCDGCKNEECFPVTIPVLKKDKRNKKPRRMLCIELACCEKCIDKLLSRLGSMTKYHDFFREPLQPPTEELS